MFNSRGKNCLEVIKVLLKLASILVLLYFFICSLDVLQDAFQLVGGRTAGKVLGDSKLLNNPICGLMIGVMVTVLVQSSSTSTSIVVSMVGSGLLQVRQAIPIIMGSNIGTTVTNTIVALTQSTDREMMERAFAGATVHDMFNWLTVAILMAVEAASGYLENITRIMTENISVVGSVENPQFLKVITKPLTHLIIQVNRKVIEAIAKQSDMAKFPLMKKFCMEAIINHQEIYDNDRSRNVTEHYLEVQDMPYSFNIKLGTYANGTVLTWSELDTDSSTYCQHIFSGTSLTDAQIGAILLTASLVCMISCLVVLVKILNSLLGGPLAAVVKRFINSDLPGCAACLTGYVAILIGAIGTVLVQSSSVFTSVLTPLVGLGLVTVERVYPLTLGSNIGTTITGILAALTANSETIRPSLQIALVHLFFNITGIIIFFPIPFMRQIPISMAKSLAKTTANHRWFAVVYLAIVFLLLPLSIFALSLAGWYVLVAVASPIALVIIFVVVVNVLKRKKPECLPTTLQTWDFLPEPMRSLNPYERCFARLCCCRSCCHHNVSRRPSDESIALHKKHCYCLPTVLVVPKSANRCCGGCAGAQQVEIVVKECCKAAEPNNEELCTKL